MLQCTIVSDVIFLPHQPKHCLLLLPKKSDHTVCCCQTGFEDVDDVLIDAVRTRGYRTYGMRVVKLKVHAGGPTLAGLAVLVRTCITDAKQMGVGGRVGEGLEMRCLAFYRAAGRDGFRILILGI